MTIKFTVADSETVKARIEAHTLDIGVVFEDELVAKFARKPLFRQRLYLIAQSAREATTNLTGTSECRAQYARSCLHCRRRHTDCGGGSGCALDHSLGRAYGNWQRDYSER